MNNKRKNSNFTMSDRLTPSVENMMANEHPSSIPVYNALRIAADKYNVCEPTEAAIAEKIHRAPKTVARALKYLDSKGIIKILKIKHTKYYILNIQMFFQYITHKERNGITKEMHFNTPAEICRKDNPEFFKEYDKYLSKVRSRRKSSKLSSYGVIKVYAKTHHNLPKSKPLSSDNIRYMKQYLMLCVNGLCRSKLYRKVGAYLVDKLPMKQGKLLSIKNEDISNALKGKVGKTTVFQAIAHFTRSRFLLHLRGQMAIEPHILSNAKRSAVLKSKPQRDRRVHDAKIQRIKHLEKQLKEVKAENAIFKQNKKQLINKH